MRNLWNLCDRTCKGLKHRSLWLNGWPAGGVWWLRSSLWSSAYELCGTALHRDRFRECFEPAGKKHHRIDGKFRVVYIIFVVLWVGWIGISEFMSLVFCYPTIPSCIWFNTTHIDLSQIVLHSHKPCCHGWIECIFECDDPLHQIRRKSRQSRPVARHSRRQVRHRPKRAPVKHKVDTSSLAHRL